MGKALFPPCPSGRSLQTNSSVQEYARLAAPDKKVEKGFSNRFYPLDWLCCQHTDAAFCVGCERVMPQTRYLLPLASFISVVFYLFSASNSVL